MRRARRRTCASCSISRWSWTSCLRLEARHTELEAEIRLIETNIATQQRSRQQSSTGLCPFLDEPCLNIQKRGQNSLVTYFDGLISADQVRLKPLRAKLEDVSITLDRARQVQKYYARLPEYQELAARSAALRAECDERLAALETERREIARAVASAPDETAIQRARQAYERSDRADRQRAALPELQATRDRATVRREALQRDRAQLEAQLASLRDAPETLAAIEQALRQLGDPRGQSAVLRAHRGGASGASGAVPQGERRRHCAGDGAGGARARAGAVRWAG